jgi:rubredoxin
MATSTRRWVCTACGYIYEPERGDPEAGIPPGTPFEELPDDWQCPVCYVPKDAFDPLD